MERRLMSKKIIKDGSQTENRGHQPRPSDPKRPSIGGGHQPTSTGDNPGNKPTPPKKD